MNEDYGLPPAIPNYKSTPVSIPTLSEQEKMLSEPLVKRMKGSIKKGLKKLSKRFRKKPKPVSDPATYWYYSSAGGRKKSRKPKRTKKLKKRTRKPKRTKKRTRRP